MTNNKRVTSLDKVVGARLRQLRVESGLTMQECATSIQVTTQQLAKYEKAINRISVSRLISFTEALKVHINSFFNSIIATEKQTPESAEYEEIHELVSKKLKKIKNPAVKEAIVLILKSI